MTDRYAEVLGDGVEMAIIERHALMRAAQVTTAVFVRATEDHGQECPLLGVLPLHVHIVEKVADPLVGQDPAVEDVDGRINGGRAAQFLVDRHAFAPCTREVDGCPVGSVPAHNEKSRAKSTCRRNPAAVSGSGCRGDAFGVLFQPPRRSAAA